MNVLPLCNIYRWFLVIYLPLFFISSTIECKEEDYNNKHSFKFNKFLEICNNQSLNKNDFNTIIRKKKRNPINRLIGLKNTKREVGPAGPPGPPGPPGTPGLDGQQFFKDIGKTFQFEIFLFNTGDFQFNIVQAIPYIVSPSGKIILGNTVVINLMELQTNNFVELSSLGMLPLTIEAPEYGTYQIGINVFSQTPTLDKNIFNLYVGANITSCCQGEIEPSFIEIPITNSQKIHHSKGKGLQLQTSYTYIPFNPISLY